MMEATPASPFEVPEPDLLFEFQIVAFDTPAHLGQVDEFAEGDVGWQRRQPILGRLGLAGRPLDQQPFLRYQFHFELGMSNPNANAGEARRQPFGRALSPPDRLPGVSG